MKKSAMGGRKKIPATRISTELYMDNRAKKRWHVLITDGPFVHVLSLHADTIQQAKSTIIKIVKILPFRYTRGLIYINLQEVVDDNPDAEISSYRFPLCKERHIMTMKNGTPGKWK